MKKRTVKDFIALYAPEDEEKLVLIQDGVSADKTFLDTYWAAHTHALAMADVQTGQAISGRCYLSWPLTDKERESGGYSKRFAGPDLPDQSPRLERRCPQRTSVVCHGGTGGRRALSGTGGALGGIHKAHSSGGRSAGNPHAGS